MGVAVAFTMVLTGMGAGDRGAGARRYARAEIPPFAGRRKPPAGFAVDLA
jgi:hypothetical protein